VKPASVVLAFLLTASAFGADLARLTPAQQRALREPAAASPRPAFHFSNPPGPQFSAAEKQAQREAGRRIVPLVTAAFAQGAESVRIPPGDYRFGQETWGRDGAKYPLEFVDLARDAEHPFTIDATGVTLWFDLADDQAPTAHFCLAFKNCGNLVFRGATLDRGTRGDVEGRITALDVANNRIEIEPVAGVSVPAKFSQGTEQRVLPFKADGTFCAPLYALQQGGVRLKYRGISPSGGGRYWVEMLDRALLETVRDPRWLRAYGEQGVLRVGDGLSCVYSVAESLSLIGCKNMTMQDLRVYVTKGCPAESYGYGGHLWTNCYFGPRPCTNQWQGGEGYMFNATRHGTTLDRVTIVHTADDAANIHGYWGYFSPQAGNRLVFSRNPARGWAIPPDLAIGDKLLFYDRASGMSRGRAAVRAIDGNTVAIDGAAEDLRDCIARWPEHECAGWTIQNCDWSDDYQRLMIQSGPGVVRNCRFTRLGSSIELNCVFPGGEGGIPRDISIRDNVFADVCPQPRSAAISTYIHTFGAMTAHLAGNITIEGNLFERPGGAAIELSGVEDCRIAGNRFVDPVRATALAAADQPYRRQAIYLSRCRRVTVAGNRLDDAGHFTSPDAGAGSRMLGLGPGNESITQP